MKTVIRFAAIALVLLLSFTVVYAADYGVGDEWNGVKTLIDFDKYEPRLIFRPDLENVSLPFDQRIKNGTYWDTEKEEALRNDGTGSLVTKHPVYLSPAYRITINEMQLDRWKVELNPSARKVQNRVNSYCRKVFIYTSGADKAEVSAERKTWPQPRDATSGSLLQDRASTDSTDAIDGTIHIPFTSLQWDNASSTFTTQTSLQDLTHDEFKVVLGARIHFPDHWFNAWAKIKPPYEITAYQLPRRGVYGRERYAGLVGGEVRNVGNGVLYNVGDIKWIRVKVSGRNFNHGFAIRLKDQNEQVREYFLGYLYYAGWRILEWTNPNYIESIDHREIFRLPLYPREIPFKKLDSFVVYRHGDQLGGDFVVYIEKVWVNYDLAFSPVVMDQLSVQDENIWKIITDQTFKDADVQAKKRSEEIDLMMQQEGVMSSYNDTGWPNYVNQ